MVHSPSVDRSTTASDTGVCRFPAGRPGRFKFTLLQDSEIPIAERMSTRFRAGVDLRLDKLPLVGNTAHPTSDSLSRFSDEALGRRADRKGAFPCVRD